MSGALPAALSDGPLQKIQQALGPRLAGTHTGIRAHSPREDVAAAARAARDAGGDLLVAVGGGSVIDASKAVAMCLWHGITEPAQFEALRHVTGQPPAVIEAPPKAIRIVAVSTTLSAAEFTATAGVTESATRAKQSFRHRLFVPISAVLDPAATLPTPLRLLFGTGLRAVDHAVESYCAQAANTATEMHSLEGLRRLALALPAIARDPLATAPRLEAQIGMWQAITGSAAGAGTGASHGIGYALGATFGVAHGETSCVMLPAVLRWNASVNADRQATLAAAMGQPGRAAGDLVEALVRSLDLPDSLQALGIGPEHHADIAERAMAYAQVHANPRPIRGPQDVLEILALAAR